MLLTPYFERAFFIFLISVTCFSCKEEKKNNGPETRLDKIEVQGHRGSRGYMPENSIPGFITAIKQGVDVLELDVVISGDSMVVVSHEPYMSYKITSLASGDSIPQNEERNLNIFQMSYDSIKSFDVGRKGNPDFPEQKRIATYKPLLREVIDSVENFITIKNLKQVDYNIEIKSVPNEYGKYQPEPEKFVSLVMEVVNEKNIRKRSIIQSFDPKVLNIVNKRYPDVEISFLVNQPGIEKNLRKLSFTPEIYSPNYALISDSSFVDSIHMNNMRLIPWTVNKEYYIRQMIDLGVDGIITDYPDRVLYAIKNQKENPQNQTIKRV